MFSFIIIGKNEGWKLTKSIQSIIDATEFNLLSNFEIIYVDSKSTDDSIERAKKFKSLKIFEISGFCNAAIARNVGAIESIGDILFFIDGDMEIESNFLKEVLNSKEYLKYNCLTGHLDDFIYDINDSLLSITPRTYKDIIPSDIQELKTNGGIFIISKENAISIISFFFFKFSNLLISSMINQ